MEDRRHTNGAEPMSKIGDPTVAAPVPAPGASWLRSVELGDVHLAADNITSALEYFERARGLAVGESTGDRVTVELRIVECMRRRGQYEEAIDLLDQLVSLHPDDLDELSRARILSRLGTMESALARYAKAQVHCDAAYRILRGTSENEDIGMLELSMGGVAVRLGQVAKAAEFFESALFTFRRIDHREGIARALNNLGLILSKGARWREGREYLVRGLAVSEEAGNYAYIASHSVNLGILHYKTGEWSLAQQRLVQALGVFREVGNALGQVRALIALGNLKLRSRQLRVAAIHYNEALNLARASGYVREQALASEFLGEMATVQGDFTTAERLLDSGQQLGTRCAPEGDVVAEVLRRQADLALCRGQIARAATLAASAAQLAYHVREYAECGAALRVLALAVGESGRVDAAIRIARGAIELLSDTPDLTLLLESRRALAILISDRAQCGSADAHRDAGEAAALWEEIAVRYEELELPESTLDALCELAMLRAAFREHDEAFAVIGRGIDLAERHALSAWLPRLDALREQLEEQFAEETLTRSAEYQLLQELTGISPTDLAAATMSCLRMALQRTRSDRAVLGWCDAGRRVRIEAAIGLDESSDLHDLLRDVASGFHAGRRLFVSQAPGVGAMANRPLPRGAVAAVALPVQLADAVAGVLYLDRQKEGGAGAYRNADLRLLSLFSGLIAVYYNAREHERRRSSERGEANPAATDPYRDFVTCNADLRRSLGLLRKLDDANVSILISGETGTGKGLLARMVHDASTRSRGAFVPINCAALPESLLESELFGHVQGAFTGAVRSKRGLFEEAEAGSIFLDEVDKAPLGVQAKLLHVLDRHEVRPVGGTKWTSVDVRVICATNADLRRAIAEGRFLEDLYYRLNDFQVHIPPLRERREDIPLLVRRFYQQFCREIGRNPLGLSREVLQILIDYEWRGNVRELEKVVKRMLVLAEDGETLGTELLPRELIDRAQLGTPRPVGTLRAEIQRLEARLIRDALDASRGNKSEVARQLRLSYPSLLSKIKQYRLDPGALSRQH